MDELPIWGYIRKPYEFDQLASLIRTAGLDQTGLSSSAAV
jgi:hypothetical protein